MSSQPGNQQRRHNERDADQEQAIFAQAESKNVYGAAQKTGCFNGLLRRTEDIGGDGDRNKSEADGEQDLVEITRTIEPAVERAFERDADDRRGDEGHRQCRRNGQPNSFTSVTVT